MFPPGLCSTQCLRGERSVTLDIVQNVHEHCSCSAHNETTLIKSMDKQTETQVCHLCQRSWCRPWSYKCHPSCHIPLSEQNLSGTRQRGPAWSGGEGEGQRFTRLSAVHVCTVEMVKGQMKWMNNSCECNNTLFTSTHVSTDGRWHTRARRRSSYDRLGQRGSTLQNVVYWFCTIGCTLSLW